MRVCGPGDAPPWADPRDRSGLADDGGVVEDTIRDGVPEPAQIARAPALDGDLLREIPDPDEGPGPGRGLVEPPQISRRRVRFPELDLELSLSQELDANLRLVAGVSDLGEG